MAFYNFGSGQMSLAIFKTSPRVDKSAHKIKKKSSFLNIFAIWLGWLIVNRWKRFILRWRLDRLTASAHYIREQTNFVGPNPIHLCQ